MALVFTVQIYELSYEYQILFIRSMRSLDCTVRDPKKIKIHPVRPRKNSHGWESGTAVAAWPWAELYVYIFIWLIKCNEGTKRDHSLVAYYFSWHWSLHSPYSILELAVTVSCQTLQPNPLCITLCWTAGSKDGAESQVRKDWKRQCKKVIVTVVTLCSYTLLFCTISLVSPFYPIMVSCSSYYSYVTT